MGARAARGSVFPYATLFRSRARRFEAVGRAGGVHPVTALRHITGSPHRGTTHRATVARPMPRSRTRAITLIEGTNVAIIRTDCPGHLEAVGWAVGTGARAAL